jgi:hypothetical protein
MDRNILQFSWGYAIFANVLWAAMVGLIAWMTTKQALDAAAAGMPIPGGWSWPSIFLVDFLCLAAWVWWLWLTYCHWKTEVTPEYIRRASVFGARKILWTEVTSIESGAAIRIFGGGTSISIAPFVYRNYIDLFAELQKHLPRSTA